MARITVEDCIEKFETRFELVLVASNRARKLHSGESPTVEKDNDKNTVIALREIADETIDINEIKNNLIQEYQTVSSQNDEDISLEYSEEEEDNEDKLNENKNLDDDQNEASETIIEESSNLEETSLSANIENAESQDEEVNNLETEKD